MDKNEVLEERYNQMALELERLKEELKLKNEIIQNNISDKPSKLVEYNNYKSLYKLEQYVREGVGNISTRNSYHMFDHSMIYMMALAQKEDAFNLFSVLLSLMDETNTVEISHKALNNIEVIDVFGDGKDFRKNNVRFMTASRLSSSFELLKENNFIREIGTSIRKVYQVNGFIAFKGNIKDIYRGLRLIDSDDYFFKELGDMIVDGSYVTPVRLNPQRILKELYNPEECDYIFEPVE